MPRNGSGTYSLPAGNPVVAGATIEAAWANTTMSDLANEVTNSLSRNGNGGMLAPFRVADGSVSAPGVAFTNETNTGLYRAGSGEMWLTVGGVAVAQVTVNGLLIPAGKRVTLPAPVNSTDATNKTYVDTLVAPVIGFADFYLGPKSSDPLVNNSGGALVQGVTYWSSTLQQMRVYNGTNWVPMPTISSLVGQTFSGDAVDTTFTLANPTGNAINLEVFISGVRQVPTTDYSVAGVTLTFVTAPPSGTDNIFVRYAQLGTITDGAGSIVYTPAGTGAVPTTVQAKLRESVSVFDFMSAAQIADVQAGTASIDVTNAIQSACTASKRVYFPRGTYLCGSPIFNAVPVLEGLYWIAERRGGIDSADGVVIKYTGSGICFKFQEANGTSSNGGIVFENFTFQATNANGGMFQFNDPALTPVPTDTGTTPNFVLNVRFNGCAFWGAGSATQGDAIKGVKVFELVTDENCYFRGWRRAVWLYGCDNNTINGRFAGNGRHLQIESAGTFGNDNLVPARFLGYTYNAGEAQYCVWDAGNHTTMLGNDLEPLTGATAAMYLNGTYCQYYSADWQFDSSVVPFSLGPVARQVTFYSVNAKSTLAAPTIASASVVDSGSLLGDFPGVIFVNPSASAASALQSSPRVMISGGQPRTTNSMERVGGEVATANGVAQKRFVINASNYLAQSVGTGFSEPLLVADTASYIGSAIQLKSVNLCGFFTRFTVGRVINNGDTIKLTVIGKATAAPGSGTFRYNISKNFVGVTSGALSNATTYTANTATYTLTGYAVGDTLDVGLYNAGVTDGTTYNAAAIILEVVNVAIPDTSGATLANVEIEVNKLKAAMRLFGLIGG